MLPPRQSGHEHNECGLRQMEIGDQAGQDLKLIPGINKDLRPSAAGFEPSVFICRRFDGTAACGSHADHTLSILLLTAIYSLTPVLPPRKLQLLEFPSC